MLMTKLKIKGGYGEHGRSCFMIEYKDKHYIMFDCGILDTDPFPYPNITDEEAINTDFLFLSHAHKDHSGAIDHLIYKGFSGWILGTKQTIDFSHIEYDKIIILNNKHKDTWENPLFYVDYGRSGHCPGSLWFYLVLDDGYRFFYSGDFQQDPMLYACDLPTNLNADVAIVDMANDQSMKSAKNLREDLLAIINNYRHKGYKMILPVQLYGRGNELLYLLATNFPNNKIAMDQIMIKAINKMLLDSDWMQEEKKNIFIDYFTKIKKNDIAKAEIILLADTHLDRLDNQLLVKRMLRQKTKVICTGRKKEGSFLARLINDHRAIRIPYPHHSSRKDALDMQENNQFAMILPFHCLTREIWK